MTLFAEYEPEKLMEQAEKAMLAPLGAASPFWLAYAGAAGAGVAYWWMSQAMKPMNLEAMKFDFEAMKFGELPTPVMPEFPRALFPKSLGELAFTSPFVEMMAALQPEPTPIPEEDLEVAAPILAAVEPLTEAADEMIEAVAEPLETAPDDLTQLVGIGPTLAAKLSDLGVTRFSDIAAWSAEDIEKFDKSLKLMGRIGREDWIGQARQFAEA